MQLTQFLKITHRRFLEDFLSASRLNSSTISAIPSFIFLFFTFILAHSVVHRRTTSFTKFKMRLYKDLIFHWTFFYVTRAWLLLVKGVKYCSAIAEAVCQDGYEKPNNHFWPNPVVVRGVAFSILLCLAVVPGILLVVRNFSTQSIPNFLLWVGEDPWLRTEIGVSGHYLDRPPPEFSGAGAKAYRARRSTSVEFFFRKGSHDLTLRKSKSVNVNKEREFILL